MSSTWESYVTASGSSGTWEGSTTSGGSLSVDLSVLEAAPRRKRPWLVPLALCPPLAVALVCVALLALDAADYGRQKVRVRALTVVGGVARDAGEFPDFQEIRLDVQSTAASPCTERVVYVDGRGTEHIAPEEEGPHTLHVAVRCNRLVYETSWPVNYRPRTPSLARDPQMMFVHQAVAFFPRDARDRLDVRLAAGGDEHSILAGGTGEFETMSVDNDFFTLHFQSPLRGTLRIVMPDDRYDYEEDIEVAVWVCPDEEAVSVPAGITRLGPGSFQDSRVRTLTLPASLVALEEDTFDALTGLTTIEVAEGNTVYSVTGGCLYEGAVLFRCPIAAPAISIGDVEIAPGALRDCEGTVSIENLDTSKLVYKYNEEEFEWIIAAMVANGLVTLSVDTSALGFGEGLTAEKDGIIHQPPGKSETMFTFTLYLHGVQTTMTVKETFQTDLNPPAFSALNAAVDESIEVSDRTGVKSLAVQYKETSLACPGRNEYVACTGREDGYSVVFKARGTFTLMATDEAGNTTEEDVAATWACSGEAVAVPLGVKTLDSESFETCRGARRVTVGRDVTSIAPDAFDALTSLAAIEVAGGNSKYRSDGTCLYENGVLFRCPVAARAIDLSGVEITPGALKGCKGTVTVTDNTRFTEDSFTGFGGHVSIAGLDKSRLVYKYNEEEFERINSTMVTDGLVTLSVDTSALGFGEGLTAGANNTVSQAPDEPRTKFTFPLYLYSARVTPDVEETFETDIKPPTLTLSDTNILSGAPFTVTTDGTLAVACGAAGCDSEEIECTVTEGGYSVAISLAGACTLVARDAAGNETSKVVEVAWACEGEEVIVPPGVETLGKDSFETCTGATSITVGKDITSITSDAFDALGSLAAIEVAEGNSTYSAIDGCLYDARGLLRCPVGVGDVRLDSTTIQPGALKGCEGTVTVTSETAFTEASFAGFKGSVSIVELDASEIRYMHDGKTITWINAEMAGKGDVTLAVDTSGLSLNDSIKDNLHEKERISVTPEEPATAFTYTLLLFDTPVTPDIEGSIATDLTPPVLPAHNVLVNESIEVTDENEMSLVVQHNGTPIDCKADERATCTRTEKGYSVVFKAPGMFTLTATDVAGNVTEEDVGAGYCRDKGGWHTVEGVSSITRDTLANCRNARILVLQPGAGSIARDALLSLRELEAIVVDVNSTARPEDCDTGMKETTYKHVPVFRVDTTSPPPVSLPDAVFEARYPIPVLLHSTTPQDVSVSNGTTLTTAGQGYETQTLKLDPGSYTIGPETIEVVEWGGAKNSGVVDGVLRVPYGVYEISASQYAHNGGITSIHIPATVKVVGEYAFDGCTNLTSVELMSGVRDIRSLAFRGTGITTLTLPGSVASIGSYAFSDVETLTELKFEGDSKLQTLENSSFSNTGLTSLIIPRTLESIGSNAFCNTSSLASITFETGSSLTSIGSYAFESTGLTGITIPKSVKIIGSEAFYDSMSLSAVTFEEGSALEEVGNHAFGYTSINTIRFPPSVTSFGGCVFQNTPINHIEALGTASFSSDFLADISSPTPCTVCFYSCDNVPGINLYSTKAISSQTPTCPQDRESTTAPVCTL